MFYDSQSFSQLNSLKVGGLERMSYMSAYSMLGTSPCVISLNLPIRLEDGTGEEVVLASFVFYRGIN